jgi:hypothetical protein
MSDWQPIETAPKSGVRFIAYDPRHGLLFSTHWVETEQKFLTDYELWSGIFTHWVPLPAPPKE